MKLLFCRNCEDVVRLVDSTRSCSCGWCKGKYIDEINAVYSGTFAVPLGVTNSSLTEAIANRPQSGLGSRLCTFVIPIECPTFKLVDELD